MELKYSYCQRTVKAVAKLKPEKSWASNPWPFHCDPSSVRYPQSYHIYGWWQKPVNIRDQNTRKMYRHIYVHVCSVNNMRGRCSREQNLEDMKIKPEKKANNQKHSSLNKGFDPRNSALVTQIVWVCISFIFILNIVI